VHAASSDNCLAALMVAPCCTNCLMNYRLCLLQPFRSMYALLAPVVVTPSLLRSPQAMTPEWIINAGNSLDADLALNGTDHALLPLVIAVARAPLPAHWKQQRLMTKQVAPRRRVHTRSLCCADDTCPMSLNW
jgi:hypothetical protein